MRLCVLAHLSDFSAKPFNTIEAAAVALAQACMDSKLALCLVVSDTGEAANIVTKYRPPVPVMVVSSQPPVVAQRELCFGQVGAWGVRGEGDGG